MLTRKTEVTNPGRRWADRIGKWVLFVIFLLWGWRVKKIFTHLPAYEDVLEVIWGIRLYHESLFVRHTSPLFTSLVFHPLGWHTATLAHTPFLFVLALPLRELGGEAFAYNVLAIVPLFLSFAGALRFAQIFTSEFLAVIVALVFTFLTVHFSRVKGHMPMLWGFGLLPWLAIAVEKLKHPSSPDVEKRLIVATGLIWGLMINFALYSLFIGVIVFALWGFQVLQIKRLKQALSSAFIACLFALPVLGLQIAGRWQDNTLVFGFDHNVYWGASLNSVFVPSVYHPLPLIQKFARSIYRGPYSEMETPNLGLFTCALALVGSIKLLRNKVASKSPLFLAVIGLLLGLGPFLKWDGEVVQLSLFRPLNLFIWHLGYILKPQLFKTPWPDLNFENGIPLPGFVLTAVIPFWELGRVASRYAFVGGLGLLILAGVALKHFPHKLRYIAVILWLVETLPNPTGEVPLPLNLHPAYVWIAEQSLEPGKGIVDIAFPTLTLRPENFWATLLHKRPTASGSGSSFPEHFFALWAHLLQNRDALARPEIGILLHQYRIKYLLLHFLYGGEREMWEMIKANPVFTPIGCFKPLREITPWHYEICIAEVKGGEEPVNLVLLDGWSGKEEWGVWGEGLVSRAQWLALSPQTHTLQLKAFPLCVPDRRQRITIKLNGKEVASYKWEDCELWEGEIVLPAYMVKRGWNELTFEYAYALRPAEVTREENQDRRSLSVGFVEARVHR